MEKRYVSHDPKFGSVDFEFTLAEMIKQYRVCGWDEYDDENENTCKMTDQGIIDDVLGHDVDEV